MEKTNKCESKFEYGYWRTDKEKEAGFSHELISSDTKYILDITDLDCLDVTGDQTIYTALMAQVQQRPNEDWLGTR